MNNLKTIMEIRQVNFIQLANITGLSAHNLRLIAKDPNVTPRHATAEILAGALKCSVAQILGERPAAEGDKEILLKRCEDAARAILEAMRDYSNEPKFANLCIQQKNTDYIYFYIKNLNVYEGETIGFEEIGEFSLDLGKKGAGV